MWRLLSGLWLSVTVFVCALGCADQKPADLRQWRAEDHGQPAEADPGRVPTDAPADQPADPARAAQALWKVACAGCHGLDGRGGGPSLPPGANVPNFTDTQWQASRTDAALADVIRDGRNLMPPFGAQVTPDGIGVLVAHIRTLGP